MPLLGLSSSTYKFLIIFCTASLFFLFFCSSGTIDVKLTFLHTQLEDQVEMGSMELEFSLKDIKDMETSIHTLSREFLAELEVVAPAQNMSNNAIRAQRNTINELRCRSLQAMASKHSRLHQRRESSQLD